MDEQVPKEMEGITSGGEKEKPKRKRRSSKAIEVALFKAAKQLIEKVGFSKLTLLALSKKSKVEPPVIYNNYGDLEGFLEVLVRDFDFWLSDTLEFSYPEKPIENMAELFDKLIDSFSGNMFMQRLIAWEINEDNHITRRTGGLRDLNSIQLIKYFEFELKHCDIPFDHSLAILLGGIYYLILHRKSGTFNFIDFTREESIREMKETLKKMVRAIFADYNKDTNPETVRIAENFVRLNATDNDIIQATGISEEKLIEIKTRLKKV